jgi:hypothetical protein
MPRIEERSLGQFPDLGLDKGKPRWSAIGSVIFESQSPLPQVDKSAFQYCAAEGLGIPTFVLEVDWNGTSLRAPDFA